MNEELLFCVCDASVDSLNNACACCKQEYVEWEEAKNESRN